MKAYFTDWFEVPPHALEEYGAFNISLVNDLPLFIDPFLLFTSEKAEYQALHQRIIKYLEFLRDQSVGARGRLDNGLLHAWFMFPEVKQLYLGFSLRGNAGAGLGWLFARSLNNNLNVIFRNFGQEKVTHGSHLEKICLVRDGVGRDSISDFTANLIKKYLLNYTQTFTKQFIAPRYQRTFNVSKVAFDYERGVWVSREYELPSFNDDYVLLCPRDILTRDENWINRGDMLNDLKRVAQSVSDEQLRAQVNNYLIQALDPDAKEKKRREVYGEAYRRWPALIEYYIRSKEDRGDEAKRSADAKVSKSEAFYIAQFSELIQQLDEQTAFYAQAGDTLQEARNRVQFLKEEIENNAAYRLFYHDGEPIQRESDLQILYRLTWYASPSDFNSEVNNGRGPVDFKVSRGSTDKSLVEFKLAKNPQLKKNLKKQIAIYEKANRTKNSLKVIFYFTAAEKKKVDDILFELGLTEDDSIILVDVRDDNKPSASVA